MRPRQICRSGIAGCIAGESLGLYVMGVRPGASLEPRGMLHAETNDAARSVRVVSLDARPGRSDGDVGTTTDRAGQARISGPMSAEAPRRNATRPNPEG
jgi:hypothetical protein